MKKQIMSLSAFALVILAAGCAKNEITPDISGGNNINTEQISFRSSTGKTRANDNGLTELETGFNVVGLKTDGAYITGFTDPTGDVETYWKTGGAWGWQTPPTDDDKKWPTVQTDYPLTFFMAFPKTDAINKGTTSAAITALSNMTPDAGFIYNTYYNGAPIASDATQVSVDYLGAMSVVVAKPASGFADLSFKHIMSNILFDVNVPADVKAVIHSIKIANVNKSGRSYDYKTQTWTTEAVYTEDNNAHYAHFIAPAASDAQNITSAASTVNGFTATAGFNTLKLMPQTVVTPWALGTDATTADSFKKDAATWGNAVWADDATAINAWHKTATTGNGMQDSKGWEGARIEVIYCLVDTKNSKNLVGRLKDIDGAASTQYVRVGYPLDIAAIDAKGDASLMGLIAGYKYKFTISLGTADATNGILLDPDFKDENGGNTTTPVDNPTTTPGDPVTKEGVINFNVAVEDWADYAGDIK